MSDLAPYIGITDVMTYEQVERILKVFNRHLPQGSKRRLHIGPTMTYKTLHGIKCRLTDAVPKNENLWKIFKSLETMNCLHYGDYRQDPFILNDLCKAIAWGGAGINALQLDMIWPQPGQVAEAVHRSCKQLDVILQIGLKAFDQVNNDPELLEDRLQDYLGLVDYVLLDKSMGNGRTMDPDFLEPFIAHIKKRFPGLNIVVAGGLGPNRLDPLRVLLNKHPDLSYDAQSWLHPKGNILEPMDCYMAEAFVMEGLGIAS